MSIMKKFLNIIIVALVVLTSFNLVSCSDDDFTPTIFDTTEHPLDPTSYTYPLDAFVRDNFLKPYNMRYLYRMEDIGSDMDYNLVPCSYEQSLNLAVLCKYLWYDVYNEKVGDIFLKKYSPRIIHVIGSPAYNPTNHTETLGTAEGGLKITLYNAENLSINDIDYMNEYFFKTMHHEFSHILNQNVNRPTDFDLISNGKYNTSSWSDTPDSVALGQGFVSPYASSQAREDWVEVIANYIVKDYKTWDNMLNTASYEWELVTDVDATYWYKLNSLCNRGLANRDSVGYFVDVSSTAGGEAATLKIARKLIQRDSDNKYAVPDPNTGDIVYLNTSGINGRDVITRKLKMVREWLQTSFNFNLEEVRAEVQRRQWMTDDAGNFIFDENGRYINRLTYVRPDGTTLMDELLEEIYKYKQDQNQGE